MFSFRSEDVSKGRMLLFGDTCSKVVVRLPFSSICQFSCTQLFKKGDRVLQALRILFATVCSQFPQPFVDPDSLAKVLDSFGDIIRNCTYRHLKIWQQQQELGSSRSKRTEQLKQTLRKGYTHLETQAGGRQFQCPSSCSCCQSLVWFSFSFHELASSFWR